jgi:hypothetical protein
VCPCTNIGQDSDQKNGQNLPTPVIQMMVFLFSQAHSEGFSKKALKV